MRLTMKFKPYVNLAKLRGTLALGLSVSFKSRSFSVCLQFLVWELWVCLQVFRRA